MTSLFTLSRRLVVFLICLGVALSIPGLAYLGGLDLEGRKTLFILVFAMGLWLTEAIPAFAVSILIVGFQIFVLGTPAGAGTDLALAKYTQGWASPVIWLLMGGFIISLSFTLTGIDKMISRFAARSFGANAYRFLLGSMATTALLSMFISNTASTSLMIAVFAPLMAHPKQNKGLRRALLIGVPAAASVGGIATLIGSPPNAIAHSHLARLGVHLEFLSWAKFGLPIAALLLVLLWLSLIVLFKVPKDIPPNLLRETLQDDTQPASGKTLALLRRQRGIVLVTFITTLILWIGAPLHTLSVSVVSFVPMVFLTVTGVIRSADIRQIPWDTLLLIMGGISLGDSVVESGLASFFMGRVDISTLHPMLIFLLVGYVTVVFSNFVSNTASAAVLIPMLASIMPDHAVALTLTIALCASMATLLPVSTPPNAVSYATGLVAARDFIKPGLILMLVGPAVSALTLYLWLG